MPIPTPFENNRFLVISEGSVIPGVSKVSSLEWTADILVFNEGGSPVSISEPGKIKYQPLTIEREVSSDLFFEQWAQLVASRAPVEDSILKDLRIDVLDSAGQPVVSYKIYRCWPISFEAFSNLDAGGPQILKERLILVYQSFERDLSVIAPA
jgi:phage tail-like protein